VNALFDLVMVVRSETYHYCCKSDDFRGDRCDTIFLGHAVVPRLFIVFDIIYVDRIGAVQYVD
jgi:hypothetical protein